MSSSGSSPVSSRRTDRRREAVIIRAARFPAVARSDAGLGGVLLEVLAPAALPLPDSAQVIYELDPLQPLHHLEAELGLRPQSDGSSVLHRERNPVHADGEDRLRISGEFDREA